MLLQQIISRGATLLLNPFLSLQLFSQSFGWHQSLRDSSNSLCTTDSPPSHHPCHKGLLALLWPLPRGKEGDRRKTYIPAAFWKASIAWLSPGREARSCRAPIWVCKAPMLKRTLPFSKASARWWDGTPVSESYLEKGRARRDENIKAISHCSHLITGFWVGRNL